MGRRRGRRKRVTAMGRLLPAAFEAASVRYRRASLIPVRPGEGRQTEPTAAIQPWRRELVFMPLSGCLEGAAAVPRRRRFRRLANRPSLFA